MKKKKRENTRNSGTFCGDGFLYVPTLKFSTKSNLYVPMNAS